jgi:succinate dehydrogenase/fumarate reductase flavoprotein subunit
MMTRQYNLIIVGTGTAASIAAYRFPAQVPLRSKRYPHRSACIRALEYGYNESNEWEPRAHCRNWCGRHI